MSQRSIDVPYNSIEEFVSLWNTAVDGIAQSVSTHVQEQLRHACLTGSRRLIWLDMDMILFGIPRLDDIKRIVFNHLCTASKHCNDEWAQASTEKILKSICHTSRIYFDTVRHHAVAVDGAFYGHLIESEIVARLGNVSFSEQEIPFIFNYDALVQNIFEPNFAFNYVNGRIVSCWSFEQEKEIILLLLLCDGYFANFDQDILIDILQNMIRGGFGNHKLSFGY